ncbi:hypothetical protein H9P43_005872 [Blastocladiella emersonii ATCC 22665]|nr:hypothetical protein H9P43_005872 [Blastocladiella emersonii ATCC 22665]
MDHTDPATSSNNAYPEIVVDANNPDVEAVLDDVYDNVMAMSDAELEARWADIEQNDPDLVRMLGLDMVEGDLSASSEGEGADQGHAVAGESMANAHAGQEPTDEEPSSAAKKKGEQDKSA